MNENAVISVVFICLAVVLIADKWATVRTSTEKLSDCCQCSFRNSTNAIIGPDGFKPNLYLVSTNK
jgi:hypothetical protein